MRQGEEWWGDHGEACQGRGSAQLWGRQVQQDGQQFQALLDGDRDVRGEACHGGGQDQPGLGFGFSTTGTLSVIVEDKKGNLPQFSQSHYINYINSMGIEREEAEDEISLEFAQELSQEFPGKDLYHIIYTPVESKSVLEI